MKATEVIFKEYTKDIFPYFNGNGAVLHTISASCKNPKTAEIQHSFGQDECLNQFVRLKSLAEANKLLKEKPKYSKNAEYMFAVFSKDTSKKELVGREQKSNKNEKKFKILWQKSFGNKKKASYTWGWINNVMFSTFKYPEGYHSIVKISYPTKKLIFRLNFPEMYPLKGKPFVVMIDEKGKETIITKSTEIKPFKEKIPFDLGNKVVEKTFKAEISNPIQGNTYKVIWEIRFDCLPNYLDWLESKI